MSPTTTRYRAIEGTPDEVAAEINNLRADLVYKTDGTPSMYVATSGPGHMVALVRVAELVPGDPWDTPATPYQKSP